jgi:hypothetical protein
LTFFDLSGKNRELFGQITTAALRALSFAVLGVFFEKFAYLIAITALIFKNRH